MSPVKTQEVALQFSNTTSTQYSGEIDNVIWLTEVFSSNPKAPSKIRAIDHTVDVRRRDFDSSYSASTPSTNYEILPAQRKKNVSNVSFINLTGQPTKAGRNQARKLATIARKKDKIENLRKEERKFEVLTTPADEKLSERKTFSPPEPQITGSSNCELSQVSRFGSSRSDPFMRYPFELSHRERQLMDHIFYVECGTIKPYKEAFLPLGLTDKAAFHQMLANLAVQLHGHRPPGAEIVGYEKAEVLAHHSIAMAMVQKRLKDPKEAISDGTIATVIAMACYAHLTKDFTAWHLHIKGLREILTIQRVTYGQYSKTQSESLKIGFFGLDTMLGPTLSWVDANASATQDIPPRFPLSPHAFRLIAQPAIIEAQLAPTTLLLYLSLLDKFPTGERVFDLFKDTAFFASVFKAQLCYSSLSTICLDPTFSWAHVYPLTHDLLSYREQVVPDDYESVVKECCRLALSVFNTRVRKVFGIAPLVLDIYVDQLLSLLQNPNIPKSWGDFDEFKLWVLVIGAMEARGETKAGLVALLIEVIYKLGIKTHKNLENRMRGIIWVHEIDGEGFWDLESELCEIWTLQGS